MRAVSGQQVIIYHLRVVLDHFKPTVAQQGLSSFDSRSKMYSCVNFARFALQLLRTMRNYDPKDLVIELADHVKERLRRERAVEELHEKRRRKK